MKHLLVTTVLTLIIAPIAISPPAIANTSPRPSPSDRAPVILQTPYSATTGGRSEQVNTPNSPIQPSQQTPSNAQTTPGKERLNQAYPAYCKFYLSNAKPSSWQFQQDIQRCLYGQ